MRHLIAGILLLLLSSCSQGSVYQTEILPSGKSIKVLGITRMHFTKGDPALILKYQTDLPIDGIPALAKEADEIWPYFQANVEMAGLSNGAISATAPQKGFIFRTSKAYTFVYTKDQAGKWSRHEE